MYVSRRQGIVQYKNQSSTSSSIHEIDHLVESSMDKVKELCAERRRSFSGRPDLTWLWHNAMYPDTLQCSAV